MSPNYISDLSQMIRKCYKEAISFEFRAWNTLKYHLVSSNGTLKTTLVMQSQSVVLYLLKDELNNYYHHFVIAPIPTHPYKMAVKPSGKIDCFLIVFALFHRFSEPPLFCLNQSCRILKSISHMYENWIITEIKIWSIHQVINQLEKFNNWSLQCSVIK